MQIKLYTIFSPPNTLYSIIYIKAAQLVIIRVHTQEFQTSFKWLGSWHLSSLVTSATNVGKYWINLSRYCFTYRFPVLRWTRGWQVPPTRLKFLIRYLTMQDSNNKCTSISTDMTVLIKLMARMINRNKKRKYLLCIIRNHARSHVIIIMLQIQF